MRAVVMGAGAIGSLIGARLTDEHDVALVARAPHVAAIREEGLRITGHTQRTVHPEATTDPRELTQADVVLLTVKAYDTRQAIQDAQPLIGEHTYVMSLQNGLGNLETIAQHVPEPRIVGATTTHGCTFHAPGRIEHAGTGDTVIGPLKAPDLPAHHELAAALTDAGIETTVTPDIQPRLWAKAAVNAAINPITAITGLPNGALLDIEPLQGLMTNVAKETERIAREEGIDVAEDSWVDQARTVAKRTAKNRSSMLQDIQKGKRTEIEAINGHIARVAQEHDIAAPLNQSLHALVTGIEATLTYDA